MGKNIDVSALNTAVVPKITEKSEKFLVPLTILTAIAGKYEKFILHAASGDTPLLATLDRAKRTWGGFSKKYTLRSDQIELLELVLLLTPNVRTTMHSQRQTINS